MPAIEVGIFAFGHQDRIEPGPGLGATIATDHETCLGLPATTTPYNLETIKTLYEGLWTENICR